MTFGSLFAGIGGIDLGLERAGMQCVFQVENNPYACRILPKHWPSVRRWDDVRALIGRAQVRSFRASLVRRGNFHLNGSPSARVRSSPGLERSPTVRASIRRRSRSMGKYFLAWLLGVPAGVLVLIYVFTHLF